MTSSVARNMSGLGIHNGYTLCRAQWLQKNRKMIFKDADTDWQEGRLTQRA